MELTVIQPRGARVSEDRMKAVLHEVEACPHCDIRHGVIRNILKASLHEVDYTLTYYYGARPNKGSWWRKNPDGTYDVEFVPMTKVFPPPNRPWEWCGFTTLFTTWYARELTEAQIKKTFALSETVSFDHKGVHYVGIYVGGRTRATVLVGSSKWYIPFDELAHGR